MVSEPVVSKSVVSEPVVNEPVVNEPEYLMPDWPAPTNVQAVITTRRVRGKECEQRACYADFNLGFHVGDQASMVRQNWQALSTVAGLPEVPPLVSQVHGTGILDRQAVGTGCEADGVYSNLPGFCCAILTADCLPILLCDRQGREIAALHAGWRGLANNIVTAGVQRFTAQPDELLAYLGPCISQTHFEVGDEVRDAFLGNASSGNNANGIDACFQAAGQNRWRGDLYQLARLALNAAGVSEVCGGDYCTYTDSQRFYSYRRDGITGRMASIIWLK